MYAQLHIDRLPLWFLRQVIFLKIFFLFLHHMARRSTDIPRDWRVSVLIVGCIAFSGRPSFTTAPRMSSLHTFTERQFVLEQGCLVMVNSPAIGQIPPHDQRNFLLIKLFHCDLERICLALEIDQDWGIHADVCHQLHIIFSVVATRTLSAMLLYLTPWLFHIWSCTGLSSASRLESFSHCRS